MLRKSLKAFICCTVFSSSAYSNTNAFDLNFHNKMFNTHLGTHFEQQDFHLSLGYGKHTRKGQMFEISAFKSHDLNIHHFEFGVQTIHAWFKPSQISSSHSLAFAGSYRLKIAEGFYLNNNGSYSPEIFAFNSEGKNFYRFGSQLEFALMPDVQLHAGYQVVRFKVENNNDTSERMTFDESIFLGAKFTF
tara:strand:+ start:7347 stop:7916 length:570 start_codon:yes stop_codon:yes gene_type:complete